MSDKKDKPFSRLDSFGTYELRGLTQEPYRLSPEVILASPEKAALVEDIRKAMFDRCYEAWMDYHRKMEEIDRAHQHYPALTGRKGVLPGRTPAIKTAYKRLCREREALTAGADEDIEREADKLAGRDFDRELKHCECSVCKKFRERMGRWE